VQRYGADVLVRRVAMAQA